MSAPDINELDALSALLASDGWTLLQAQLEREWGADAYARRIDAAMAEAKKVRESAEQEIGELGSACRAVRVFMQYPQKRIAQLKAQANKPRGFLDRRRA